eukprot:gene29826-51878_t
MKHPIPDHNPMRGQYTAMADARPSHFALSVNDGVATVTLNRPERKNPLTFDSYAELRDWFLALQKSTDIKAVVLTGAGDNFCSGGDVHEIIEIGARRPVPTPLDELGPGEVGYLIAGIKDVAEARSGETVTTASHGATEPLPGYRDPKPMVFCGLYPIDGDDFENLRESLQKLKLNDASVTYEPESSGALGFGFRC